MIALLLTIAPATFGCSLAFVDGPPPPHERFRNFDCSRGNGWPVVDVMLAAAQALRTGYALTRSESDYRGQALSQGADVAIGGTLLAITAVSAGVGFSRVSSCREALREARRLDEPDKPTLRRKHPMTTDGTDATSSSSKLGRPAGQPKPADQD
jgi:hypothetical protein